MSGVGLAMIMVAHLAALGLVLSMAAFGLAFEELRAKADPGFTAGRFWRVVAVHALGVIACLWLAFAAALA